MPKAVSINVRIPPELHESLVALAKEEERSLNSQIVYLLRRATEARLDVLTKPRAVRDLGVDVTTN